MVRKSGIIILVFFCCLIVIAKGEQSSLGLIDRAEEENGTLLSTSIGGRPAVEAFALDEKALQSGNGVDFQPGIADALGNLGKYFLEQGEYETAHKYLSSYQKFGEQMQDSLLLAEASCQLAILYRRQSLWHASEKECRRAIELAHSLNNKALLGKFYNQLGSLMYHQEKYSLATTYLIKSLENSSPEHNRVEYAAALHNLGMVYKAQQEYRKSLHYLKQALAILDELKSSAGLSAVMINIGEIYQLYNDYGFAEGYYQKALNVAQEAGSVEQVVASYDHLARMHAEKEQYQLAYQYKSLYSTYNDSLTSLKHLAHRSEVSKKLESERREKLLSQLIKEKELDMLSREYKLSKLTISQKNELIWYACISFFLLSMLTLILYQGYKLKKRKNDQLEKEHFQTTNHNIQLQELNEKLQQSEQQLIELNETKDKFFSIISHDLRSPLNTLSSFIEIVKNDFSLFSPAEVDHFSLQMERSLHAVAALLDNLFQWASSQTGLIEFSPVEISLKRIVEENISLLQPTADLKEITLHSEVPENMTMEADVQMMRLLLRNLMSNAIKFTPRGGSVKVSSRVVKHQVVLTVEDNGLGMSEENRRKLLSSSSVFTQRGTENEKGSGLGLLLCKEFVEMHRGRIEVKSRLGEGTTFIIRLPIRTTEANLVEE